jgi:hypothetical protein
MGEAIPQMLGPDAGARIGGGVDEHLVVTHVVGKPMEDDRLVEYVVERCLNPRTVHVRMIAHPGSADQQFPRGQVGALTCM